MPHKFTMVDKLLEPPIKRAAYSDRTAWLMAVMSDLAYVRFEQPTPLDDLAHKLSGESEEHKILAELKALLVAQKNNQLENELKSDLKDLGFRLVETYDISIPLVADTQAFLAELTLKDRDQMLVLAFRGTEVKKPADIRTDVKADLMSVGPEENDHLLHQGFYEAFEPVKPLIQQTLNKPEFKDIPLYITGHSLGGALAIVATYFISNDSVGACYTFGAPRVGNLAFGQSIKTPIYRIINAADLVPRLPSPYLTEVIKSIILFLSWLPIPYLSQLAEYVNRFRRYRHFGDLRYLTAVTRNVQAEGMPAKYPGLQVIANPPQLNRWIKLFRRLVDTWGHAGIKDHSIDTYVEKLAYWGVLRNQD